jgi:nicotinamidase-related amidase
MTTDRDTLILIDPMIGFCGSSGSLAKKYEETELAEIRKTIPTIARSLATFFN